jgi:hypothetical protein
MSTSTFLSNATINLTQGATTTALSDQANTVSLMIGFDSLESTAFGDTGHRFTAGLQNVEVSMTLFLSYGAAEVEAILASCVGTGTTVLTISPSGATEGPANPEYVITNCMLADFTPINSTVGELATVEATFTGGTWVRDIV